MTRQIVKTKHIVVGAAVVGLVAAGYAVRRAEAEPVAAAPATPAVVVVADRSAGVTPKGGKVTVDQPFSADFVSVAAPVQQTVDDLVPVTGKLSLDKQQTRIASARVAGRLGRIFVFEGQSVKAGDALAEIYSPEYISAEHEFLLARRFMEALSKGNADEELRNDTATTVQSAANKLKVLGASPQDIRHLEASGQVEEYLKVRAPISGVVTQRNVDPGGYLNVGDPLMSLANLDTLWLFISTYDRDYAALRLGQTIHFESSSLPGQHFEGAVAFIAPSVDPVTHTLPIRCNVPNPKGLLRPEMFVKGTLKVGSGPAWVTPKSAVLHIRDTDYVIAKDDDQHYRRVAVEGHPLESGQYAITGGLTAPMQIVVNGGLHIN